MSKNKYISYYVDTPDGQPEAQVKEFIIPKDTTWNIYGISMTGNAAGKAIGLIKWDGKTIDAWQSDKFVSLKLPLNGDGVKKLIIDINGVSTFMGCTIYFEELGKG